MGPERDAPGLFALVKVKKSIKSFFENKFRQLRLLTWRILLILQKNRRFRLEAVCVDYKIPIH